VSTYSRTGQLTENKNRIALQPQRITNRVNYTQTTSPNKLIMIYLTELSILIYELTPQQCYAI